MQEYYLPLMDALFMDVNPIPVKDAMDMLGLGTGPLRLPLLTMDGEGKAKLREYLVKYGLMK